MFIVLHEAIDSIAVNKEIVVNTDKILTIRRIPYSKDANTGKQIEATEIKLQGMKYSILVTNTMDELSQIIR